MQLERLDRALINAAWMVDFQYKLIHMERNVSDHSELVFVKQEDSNRGPFSKAIIHQATGFTEGTMPTTYLGIPLHYTRITASM